MMHLPAPRRTAMGKTAQLIQQAHRYPYRPPPNRPLTLARFRPSCTTHLQQKAARRPRPRSARLRRAAT
jgi:hypothetical protein